MPVKIKKIKGGYQVSTPGGVKARRTTKKKAERQARLLRAVEHGWKPTGAKARDFKKSTRSSPPATQADIERGYKDLGRI
jgi:hypothetical protein